MQRLKEGLTAILPGELILILLGLGCYLATCLVLRRPLTWAWALVPGLALSLMIEAWEIWDHYGAAGLARSSGGQIAAILGRHLKDIAIMNLPAVAVFAVAVWLARAAEK